MQESQKEDYSKQLEAVKENSQSQIEAAKKDYDEKLTAQKKKVTKLSNKVDNLTLEYELPAKI